MVKKYARYKCYVDSNFLVNSNTNRELQGSQFVAGLIVIYVAIAGKDVSIYFLSQQV